MKNITRHNNGTAVVETLEGRTLMSSVSLQDGVMTVRGNSSNYNNLSVSLTSDNQIRGFANGTTKSVNATSVSAIRIIGGKAADQVYVHPDLAAKTNVQTYGGKDLVQGRAIAAGNRTQITHFSLINADTDKVIANFEQLGNGVTLNLAKLPTRNLNIVANVVNDSGGSVRFWMGGVVKVDSSSQYSFAGNSGGNYFNWTPKTGTYVLGAAPYSKDNASGEAGIGRLIHLRIVNDPGEGKTPAPTRGQRPRPTPKPAPAPTPAPAPAPAPAPVEPTPLPDHNGDAEAPMPLIDVIDNSVPFGHAIHVHGLSSSLRGGSAIDARYEWNFGDSGSKYNTLSGFNAAHVYSKPGSYTITLRVTNAGGKTSIVKTNVTVTPANRRVIYVSNDGNDSNSGLSASKPIRTFARAAAMVADDTEILFERGDTFTLTKGMSISGGSNVVIGAYGTGDRPVLKYVGASSSTVQDIVSTHEAQDVLIRDLTFDTRFAPGTGKVRVNAVRPGGQNITVRGNQVLNIDEFINNNRQPRGTLVMDNVSPTTNALRAQFIWIEGTDHVYLGNLVRNSSHENLIRGSNGASRILIAHNDLANPDLGMGGDMKATVVMQKVRYAYVADNIIRDSWVSVGPLGNGDGLSDKSARAYWNVVEDNILYDSGMFVNHGAIHTSVRGNVIHREGTAIWIDGFNSAYGRGVEDVHIYNNTAVNDGTAGQFLRLGGTAKGIALSRNLYVAPNLELGSHGSAGVNVSTSNLGSFSLISGNVWPDALTRTGGAVFMGSYTDGEYVSCSEWEAYSQVKGDIFRDATLGSTFQTTVGGLVVGSGLQRAA